MTHITTGNPQSNTSSCWIEKTWIMSCLSVNSLPSHTCIGRQCSFTVTYMSVFSKVSLFRLLPYLFSLLTTCFGCSSLLLLPPSLSSSHTPPSVSSFLSFDVPALKLLSVSISFTWDLKFPLHLRQFHLNILIIVSSLCFKGLNKFLMDAFIHLGGSIYSMGGPYGNQTLKWCKVSAGLCQSSHRGP